MKTAYCSVLYGYLRIMTVAFYRQHIIVAEYLPVVSRLNKYRIISPLTANARPRKHLHNIGFGIWLYKITDSVYLKSLHSMVNADGAEYYLSIGRNCLHSPYYFHSVFIAHIDIHDYKVVLPADLYAVKEILPAFNDVYFLPVFNVQ